MLRLCEAEGGHGPVDTESLLQTRIVVYCLNCRGGSALGLRLLPCDHVGLAWIHAHVLRRGNPGHLGLVHPRGGHPKILAMIEAYLDESGIHDGATVCVISGYFGGRGQWKRFEEAWRNALKQSQVPLGEFHAKEVIKRKGFFSGWKDDRYQRLIGDLELSIVITKSVPSVSA